MMKKLQLTLTHIGVVVLLVVSPLLAWTGVLETLAEADQGMSARSETYRSAQRALEEQDWTTAEELFGKVAATGEADADAALYWQAFAQLKRGRSVEAGRTLRRLESSYPDSPWVDDAKALAAEVRAAGGGPIDLRAAEDDELKLYALNSLMQVESERAIPILEQFLAGDHSLQLKERALFVLSQSGSPRAREILVAVARGQQQPELAREAIQYLGLSGGGHTGEILEQIYQAATEPEVKRAVLEAMMLGGFQDRILAAARSERDTELRAGAIELLGAMNAAAELRELYAAASSVEIKKAILEGLFLASDVDALAELARTEKAPEARAQAIESLGLIDSAEAGAALEALWSSSTEREVKQQILEAFFLRTDAQALIGIVRGETDRDLRMQALEYLSMMDSEEAVEYLLEVLEEKGQS